MSKDKTINVLFISSWYPNKFEPTNGNFIERHAQAVNKFANVTALHVVPHESITKTELTETIINEIPTVYIYYPSINAKLPFAAFFKLIRKIKMYKKGYQHVVRKYGKPAIIHANITYPNGIFAWFLKKTQGIPYIITEHWTVYIPVNRHRLTKIIRFISKIIAQNADYITPVSYDLLNAMKNLGFNTNYEVVPNVVNTNLFQPKQIQNPKKQILHVSTLKDDHKNVSGILETITELSEERSDFTLKIVGDGDLSPHIAYANKLGLTDKKIISFEGEKSIEEIAHLMQQSDIFLLFSNYENLPCVIIEAISSGLPVVSSKVGGIHEMLDKDTGILVPPKDKKALKKALITILDNLENYNKIQMHNKAVNTYSETVIGKKFISIYEKILSSQK